MITVHHLENSRSHRVLWLFEELGLPYEVRQDRRDPQTMLAPASLRDVHPRGKSPVVTDGGETLAESGYIIEHYAERDGRLVPPRGSPQWNRYRYWMHYAEGSAMPPLLMKLVFDRIERSKAPFFAKPIVRSVAHRAKKGFVQPQIDLHLDYLEGELGKAAWFAGDEFCAADIQMSFPVEAARARGGLDARRPRLMAYLDRIHGREGYRRAIERGGELKLG
ncbi:MAG: glutathione S-transferase [Usitatibacter sp.]